MERGYDFTYNTLDYSDLETIAAIYERLGTTEPLAFIIDPTEQLYDKDNVFIYGKFSGDLKAKHKVTTLFDLPLGVVEAF